ncbi:DUF881 domain-containing protein [Dermatophilaceae bacterium Soc4.6]
MGSSPSIRLPRRTGWALVVPLVALAAGLLFATSFQTAQGTDLRSAGRNLPDLVRSGNRAVELKEATSAQLQAQVDQLTRAASPGSAQVRQLTLAADAAGSRAGTQPVHGPALTVSLDDAHRRADTLPKPYGPDDIVVHQQDVQGVVNALWRGGAEAMTIQGQRVVATSAVRCVGNTLILQGRVYSPPYVVAAIGPLDGMRAALGDDPQVQILREWVAAVGLGYVVTDQQDATFPAYSGLVQQQRARVTSSP